MTNMYKYKNKNTKPKKRNLCLIQQEKILE